LRTHILILTLIPAHRPALLQEGPHKGPESRFDSFDSLHFPEALWLIAVGTNCTGSLIIVI
jgi:hypothetical protein